MSDHLPIEFHHDALIERIVRGAVDDDPVRLHGAIFAALEIHGPASARDDVFAPALGAVEEHDSDSRPVVDAAIRRHLDHPRWSAA